MTSCLYCAHFMEAGVNPSSNRPGEFMRSDKIGLCRRNPPVWLPPSPDEESGSFCFPAIHQDHRCGEWSYWGPWDFMDEEDPGGGGGQSATVTPLFPSKPQAA